MLCQFSVKNYRSIKDKITLDMQAAKIKDHIDEVITCPDGEVFLPLAVIYGPNGSGKSNILSAINNLIGRIMRPICAVCENDRCQSKNFKSPTIPFKFSEETISQPTEFEIFFRTRIAEYRYILFVKKEDIIYESLDKKNINGSRYIELFKRSQEDGISLYNSLKKINVNEVSDNISLISYLAITNNKNSVVKDVIDWFEGDIVCINFGSLYEDISLRLPKNGKYRDVFYKMLHEMDIDISSLRIEKRTDETSEEKTIVYSKHDIDGNSIELQFTEESEGTRKIIKILSRVIDSIFEGCTLVIDELDAKLHPQLIKYIINLFRNQSINKTGAQLVFTSHDLATMNNDIFRRDEIWFVAKNIEQSSSIYSLVEFKDTDGDKIRKDASFNKQYLEGKYGADPYLQQIINWEAL